MIALAAGALAALAVLVLALPRPSRLSRVLPGSAPARPATALGPRAACGIAAVAAFIVFGYPAGLLAGAALAVGGPRLLATLEPQEVRAKREQLTADFPLVLDLLAACLAGGAPLATAAAVVAESVGGPCQQRLQRVLAALAVGSPAPEAWAALGSGDDPLAPAARMLARATEGGAPVAAVVSRLAADARLAARAQGERKARHAGVLAVAPLGLCFLPAFLLLGVVPLVAGLAAPLLAAVR